MLCKNIRSSAVSACRSEFASFAGSSVEHSRQHSARGFAKYTFLRHHGHRQWTTSSCVVERPTTDMRFGTPPHSQISGNFQYSISWCAFLHLYSVQFFQRFTAGTTPAMVNDGWITTDTEKEHPAYMSVPGLLPSHSPRQPSIESRSFWRIFDFPRSDGQADEQFLY
jgi:hypothetical protein